MATSRMSYRSKKPPQREVAVDTLASHERPLGRFQHDAEGVPFNPLRSLAEARQYDDAFVILQGDWGGQIYLVCPVSLVKCGEAHLRGLLSDLDRSQGPSNAGDGAEMFFERFHVPAVVSGGMGGGQATHSVWVHPHLDAAGWAPKITATLSNTNAP